MFQLNGNFGRAVDLFGSFVNFPGRVVMSMDEAFKGLTYRMEFPALAHRKAVKEFGKQPKTVADIANVDKRANQILEEIESSLSLQLHNANVMRSAELSLREFFISD